MDEYERIEQKENEYYLKVAPLEVEIERLRDGLKMALAILEIYYVPNSDGSTPPLDRIRKLLEMNR